MSTFATATSNNPPGGEDSGRKGRSTPNDAENSYGADKDTLCPGVVKGPNPTLSFSMSILLAYSTSSTNDS
jgi:hypothetical protein